MLNPVLSKTKSLPIRLEHWEWKKLTTQIGFENLLWDEKSQRFLTDFARKIPERNPDETLNQSRCLFDGIWQGLDLIGDAIGWVEVNTSYPFFQRRQAFGAMSMWRMSWALRCLLLIFKPTHEKANPPFLSLISLLLRRKRQFWMPNIRELSSKKPYVFGRSVVVDSVRNFNQSKFGCALSFLNPDISTFKQIWMFRACNLKKLI